MIEVRSAQEIWETALGELQIQVNKSNYKTWLEKTTGISYQDSEFTVGAPSIFVAEYLNKNQRSLIEKTLIGLMHHNLKVTFQISNQHQASSSSYNTRRETRHNLQAPPLNPKYTFDSFVVGSGNRLAYAAALGIAENRENNYNPLFIHGGVGLGKTHLLHAMGHTVLKHNKRLMYVSGEQFTNEFVNAIRDRDTREFRDKYRNVDFLLIDDIQFISGKKQTQESFFHTFNELHNTNRQIAVTSDIPPKAIPQLQERLRSRLEWGLVADIKAPDFETRLSILKVKVKNREASIAPEVLELIARRIQQNIRQLEGSVNRIIALAKLLRTSITPDLAARALDDISSKAPRDVPDNPNLIIEAVACNFQLTPLDLKSRKRDKETTLARRVAMYLLRQETSRSLTQIGSTLGDRDHSAVSAACQKMASDLEASPYLKRKVQSIRNSLHVSL